MLEGVFFIFSTAHNVAVYSVYNADYEHYSFLKLHCNFTFMPAILYCDVWFMNKSFFLNDLKRAAFTQFCTVLLLYDADTVLHENQLNLRLRL